MEDTTCRDSASHSPPKAGKTKRWRLFSRRAGQSGDVRGRTGVSPKRVQRRWKRQRRQRCVRVRGRSRSVLTFEYIFKETGGRKPRQSELTVTTTHVTFFCFARNQSNQTGGGGRGGGRKGGRGRGRGRGRGVRKSSDGKSHLGSSLEYTEGKAFPSV